MPEYISRSDVVNILYLNCDESCASVVFDVEGIPAADVAPVVHGEWKHTGITNVYGGHQHKCSVCGYSLMVSQSCDNENYCCSCGAKMEDKQ